MSALMTFICGCQGSSNSSQRRVWGEAGPSWRRILSLMSRFSGIRTSLWRSRAVRTRRNAPLAPDRRHDQGDERHAGDETERGRRPGALRDGPERVGRDAGARVTNGVDEARRGRRAAPGSDVEGDGAGEERVRAEQEEAAASDEGGRDEGGLHS